MKPFIAALLLIVLAGGIQAAEPVRVPAWIGVRGPNGTGVYPDAKPPTTWDLATGRNVRWVVPLQGWGHGQPVVADGKIFLLLEPDVNHLFPRVQCLDLATGQVRWEDELDHLPIAEPNPAKRAELYRQWKKFNQMMADGAKFEAEFMAAHKKSSAAKQETIDRWKARGYVPIWRLKEATATDGGQEPARLRLLLPKDEDTKMRKLLGRYGCWEDIYQSTCNFACIGHTFGAPVWAQGALYVATAGGVFAKYNADGKRQWINWVFSPERTNLGGSGHDTCVRSPLVWGDLFISTAANNLVALDCQTGKVRFKDALSGGSIASPIVLSVNRTDVLLSAGPRAYRLPEGKPLKIEGWRISGMQALVKHDERDVVFFCGSGEHSEWPGKGACETPPPAAVRYRLEGETLRGTVIWSGVQDPSPRTNGEQTLGMGGTAPWLLYDQGRLFHRGGPILDARTGKIVAGKFWVRHAPLTTRAVPATAHLLQLANAHVYGWDGNELAVFTQEGQPVAVNRFVPPSLSPEQLPIWQGVDSTDRYGAMISYSSQFSFGPDCLVARALMHLYCFSEPVQSPPVPNLTK